MILGITGTNGAGKGTVGQYLSQKHRFNYFSARDVWNEEIAKRGLPSNRDTMVAISNELRAVHGADYFAQSALKKAAAVGGDVVFESIRTVGEAKCLKQQGALLWAVDADIKLRYERVVLRQSETDQVSFEKFVADEQREWENIDPAKQNLKAVMAMANHVFLNNGTQDELFAQVEVALKSI